VIEPPPTDRQLVDEVLVGNGEAFRVLVERASPPVLGVCRRILRDSDEAEDVAQDAFLRAYRALATFRGDGAFGAWVTRIAVRLAIARLASRRDLAHVSPDHAAEWAVSLDSRDDPEARALDKEQRRAIRDAVGALPLSQRSVVALRFYGDLSLEEISRLTTTPLGTVKSRLHRGIENLRQRLASRSTP
jgi:RNA polymerase sigma-70 factor (ECF subfamily)